MKCKDCNACEKGFFKSKPDTYVCIGVSEPFIIKDINNECTEYPEKNKKNKEDTPMREILFRAKLKDWKTNSEHNRWVEGFYLKRKETTYCFAEDYEKYPVKTLHFIAEEYMTDWGLPNDFRLYEIDPDTICQYTEMNDKDGNKIWENDIIKTQYGRLCIVIWFSSDSYCGWDLKPIITNDNLRLMPPLEGFVFCSEDNEVVGNIIDNSDSIECI